MNHQLRLPVVSLALCCVFVTSAFAIKGNGLRLSQTSAWPKYMGNTQNNGSGPSIPAADAAKEGDILWQKDNLGENLESGPAVDSAGNVYVIGDGTIYSYTSGGSSRWSTRISGGDADTPCVSPDNSVVYASGTAGVYALNASNGSQIWHSPLGEFHTVPCVSADGSRVYIGSEDLGGSGTIYALNASDGSTAWSYHPNGADGFMGGAALDVDGNIYVPGQDGILYSLKDNGSSYSVNWTFDLGSEARQPVTIGGNGYVYATCNTGVVHKINIGTGAEDTSGSWPALGGVGEVFASMCFAADGTLYVNAEDYRLHALNPDGSEKWSYKFERWGSDPLVRDDGMIIVMGQINGAGRVCALRDNGSSASLEWTSPRILANLTLNETNVNIAPDGTIYVHSGDQPPLGLFAVKGNGRRLSTTSPWPKYMGNIKNNGLAQDASSKNAGAPKEKKDDGVHPDTSGWKSLFGADLANAVKPEGVWTVADGVLTASEDQAIWSARDYDSFVLDLEFKNAHETNSGVIVYCGDTEEWIPNSVEIQIADDYAEEWAQAPKTWQCGAVFGHLAPSKSVVKEPGEWNRITIKCMDRNIDVALNGEHVISMDMSLWTSTETNPDGSEIPPWLNKPLSTLPTQGKIGLQGKHAGAPVWFRNILIKELK